MLEACISGGCTKEGKQCLECGATLPPPVRKGGRRRVFCSVECSRVKSRRNAGYLSKKNATCKNCGEPVPQTPGKGRVIRYCSNRCRVVCLEHRNVTCTACGICFRGSPKRKFCSRRCRWKTQLSDPVPCAECGTMFVRTHHSSRYCSKACSKVALDRNTAANAMRARLRAVNRQCLCCLRPFRKRSTGRNAGKYCSRECGYEARRLRLPCARLTRRTGSSLDAQLAIWFHSWDVDSDEPKNIGHRRGGHKHRCRLYGCHYESFSSRSIFIRDNWTCQICGCELRRSRPAGSPWKLEPDSPTIDHIVPLSFGPAGPGHTPLNVQAACWSCNSKKGDTVPDSFAAPCTTSLD